MKNINAESEVRFPGAEWISIVEAARITGKSTKTIYRYVRSGRLSKLDDYTAGGARKYLVRRDEVEALKSPRYAIDRVRDKKDREEALAIKQQAFLLISDNQIRIQDNIETTRTNLRRLSIMLLIVVVTALLITGWLIFSYWKTNIRLREAVDNMDNERTYMSKYVQDSLDKQENKLESYSDRFVKMEKKIDNMIKEQDIEKKEKEEKRKRRKFPWIF